MKIWSFQLYSARNSESLDDVLALLSAKGYRQVEGYGGLYEDLAGLVALLDKHHLTMPTGHFDFDTLVNDLPRALEIAKALKMKTLICPYLAVENRPTTAKGWFVIGTKLEKVYQQLSAHGFDLAWHNHDFELFALDDGTYPIEALLAGGPNVKWQMDVAWVSKSAANPSEWLERYKTRLCAVHLKDIAPEGECQEEDGWADLGYGVLPWANFWRIIEQSSATHFVMEHDNPNDLARFATRAIKNANQLAINL